MSSSAGIGESFLILLLLAAAVNGVTGFTDPQDAVAIRSLKDGWQNLPPNWLNSDDPCGDQWVGITCNNYRIISLELSSTHIIGLLSSDISELNELRTLQLSSNLGITGSLTPNIGNLKKLNALILMGCNFTGRIPEELVSLSDLTYFHLSKNQLSGPIPSRLFSTDMNLLHILFDGNEFTGNIPDTLGLVQSLEVLWLDRNSLTVDIPSSINNLT